MEIKLKRIYAEVEQSDGYRILIDRLWPRGISKEKAQINEWLKDIAPTNELRKWFHQENGDFSTFKERYLEELHVQPEKLAAIDHLLELVKSENITLLYGAKDERQNQAVILKEYLETLKR